jgi:ATP-dependent Lon protease
MEKTELGNKRGFAMPAAVPVMPLSGSTLFPHAMLPLFIFESRYREMLLHALETQRMFCIGTLTDTQPDPNGEEADSAILPLSTVGYVRACVLHPDGTYHLLLQGMSRVRLCQWEQRAPFRVARIEPLPSIEGNAEENRVLARRLLRCVAQILKKSGDNGKRLTADLTSILQPEVLADFVSANFLSSEEERRRMLETLEVGPRLRYLLKVLDPDG